ncbi:Cytochrome c [Spirosomataceae bacterium TFI 002]|nr:Cytochrome c [Spirosomataceae bacterium TFI 002]
MKEKLLNRIVWYLGLIRILIIFTLFLASAAFVNFFFGEYFESPKQAEKIATTPVKVIDEEFSDPVLAPSDELMLAEPNKDQLLYGKELITNTSFYLGFNGKVMKNTNGQNCQNCHLKAGTQPFGNNFLGVTAMYPQIRKRSGKMTDIVGRVNGCLQRSLNGKPLDADNPEMAAMVAYITWLGKDSPKGIQPKGTKVYSIKLLDRAADPQNGEIVYREKCQSCHQQDGQGVLAENGRTYTYPPLWGKHSYNDGAGLYRMSKFAGFVRLNMPFGATYERPMLTDEEAWDIAAFVNSQERPVKEKANDWPNIADKPYDHPFGPFADPYPESQHKYGPFKPIKDFYKN